MNSAICIGMDLSGPSNSQDTAMCVFDGQSVQMYRNCSDQAIYGVLSQFNSNLPVVIAADAPLTYQDGGGYRDIDRALRQKLNSSGFSKIGVMAPTMTRMAYLTLRGMRLKELCTQFANIELFETHPGAALAFSGIEYDSITQVKSDKTAFNRVVQALHNQFPEISEEVLQNDHELMAASAMLSAYRYTQQQSLWQCSSQILGQPNFIL